MIDEKTTNKINTFYQAVCLVIGFTRKELNERVAMKGEKRIAQDLVTHFLLNHLRSKDIHQLTGYNENYIYEIKQTDLTPIKRIVYEAIWKKYTELMK